MVFENLLLLILLYGLLIKKQRLHLSHCVRILVVLLCELQSSSVIIMLQGDIVDEVVKMKGILQ